jgi:hypothetical protein
MSIYTIQLHAAEIIRYRGVYILENKLTGGRKRGENMKKKKNG